MESGKGQKIYRIVMLVIITALIASLVTAIIVKERITSSSSSVLAHNVGKVLTHTSITQQIWGSTQENDIASLRVYMASLRKKLERYPDAPHLIQTHVGVGYRMLRVENDEA